LQSAQQNFSYDITASNIPVIQGGQTEGKMNRKKEKKKATEKKGNSQESKAEWRAMHRHRCWPAVKVCITQQRKILEPINEIKGDTLAYDGGYCVTRSSLVLVQLSV
jgi:hypothetical protein